jgi:hypothetical protein
MAGVDLTAVKKLLGHKDIKMTLRYAHFAPAHKRKAVEVMGNLLSNPTEQKHTGYQLHNYCTFSLCRNRKGVSLCQLTP